MSESTDRSVWTKWQERITSTRVWKLLSATFSEWKADNAGRLAAAMSYYALFSLAPLLLMVLYVAGLFLDRADVRAEVLGQIGSLVGEEAAQVIRLMIEGFARGDQSGTLPVIIGTVTLLVSATAAIVQLQDAMNVVWDVEPVPGRGLMGLFKDRILAVGLILFLALLLMASLLVSTGMAGLTQYLQDLIPWPLPRAWLINLVLAFILATLMFAMIFKYLPAVEIAWRDVWIGAVATSILVGAGQFALGYYLGRTGATSAYGAAGSPLAILLWLYYSAQILFFGAEFTQVAARQLGKRIVPADGARWAHEPQRLEGRSSEGRPTSRQGPSRDRQARPAQPARKSQPERGEPPAKSTPPKRREVDAALPPEAVTLPKDTDSEGGRAADVWRFMGVIAGSVVAALGLGNARSRRTTTRGRKARRGRRR